MSFASGHGLCCCALRSVAQLGPMLCDPTNCNPPGSAVHGDSPSKNTGVDCPLQGIFPTQGSDPGVLHCRRVLYQLSHQGITWTIFTSNECVEHLLYTGGRSIAGEKVSGQGLCPEQAIRQERQRG